MSAAVGAFAVMTALLALVLLPHANTWRPRWPAHPDTSALRDCGWRATLRSWEGIRLAVTVVAMLALSVAGLGPVGLAFGIAPSIAVRVRAQSARDRARSELPRLLGATHGGLRSGLALPEALRRALQGCPDPIARRPFEDAIGRFDLGDPLDAGLRAAASSSRDRLATDALHTLALGVAERLPVERAAALLEAVAERATHEVTLDAEIRARSAGVRSQMYLLAALVPALSLYLVVTMPGLAATLTAPLGRTVLIPGAVMLELAGILVSRGIIRSVSR